MKSAAVDPLAVPTASPWNRALWWAPLFLMAAVIWLMSSDLGAMSHQSRLLGPLLTWLGFSPQTVIQIIVFIRKNAHMGEYAFFAVLAWRGWNARPLWRRRAAWRLAEGRMPFLMSVAWASLDEFHQTFVPSRTGAVGDVGWDSVGALLGLTMLWLWHRGARPEKSKL